MVLGCGGIHGGDGEEQSLPLMKKMSLLIRFIMMANVEIETLTLNLQGEFHQGKFLFLVISEVTSKIGNSRTRSRSSVIDISSMELTVR